MRRQRRGSASDAGLLAIVGGMFLFVGTILSTVMCWGLPVDLMLAKVHAEAGGTVDAVAVNRNVRINGRRPTRIQYHYEVAGHRYEGAVNTFNTALIGQAEARQQVPVEYVPDRPDWSRVKGTMNATFGYIGLFILAFPLFGLSLLGSAVIRKLKAILAAPPSNRPAGLP